MSAPMLMGGSFYGITKSIIEYVVALSASPNLLRRRMGGMVPPNGDTSSGDPQEYRANLLSNPRHNWDQRFKDGPLDLGFDSSFITMTGIQDPPYAFFQDDVLLKETGLCDAWQVDIWFYF